MNKGKRTRKRAGTLRVIWLLVAVLGLVPLRAERIRTEDAKRAAMTVLNGMGGRCNSIADLTDISEMAGYQNLYVFNGREGYVVMPKDNRITPVLCYSPEGNLNAERVEMLGVWLDRYEEQIGYVVEHRLSTNESVTRIWDSLIDGNIGQLVMDRSSSAQLYTNWGQGDPYNLQCPYNNLQEKYCYTGSVATAMAQIMKHWEHPRQGNGHHTNGANYSQYGSLYADFEATSYDWIHMSWSNNNPTYEEKQAVAQLMSHCGIAVNMVYDYNMETSTYQGSHIGDFNVNSNTYCYLIQDAFENHFYYKCPRFVERRNVSGTEEWVAMLLDALEADSPRPVLYTAKNNNGIFHAFVCDGVTNFFGMHLFHFVWGMNGMSSNYCYLDNLAPELYPIYDNEELAFFGIEPDSANIIVKKKYNDENLGSLTMRHPKGNTIVLTAPEEASSIDPITGATIRYSFYRWVRNGMTLSYNPTIEVKVEEDEEYHAQYELTVHHINVDCSPEEGGTATGGGTYGYGTHVILMATPNIGYAFEGWYEGEIRHSYTPDYEIVVGGDRNLTAHFVACNFTVNAMAAPMTGGTVSGSGTYPASSSVTVTATPTGSHYFRGWMENGVVVSNQASYTFTLSSDRNLIAVFGATTPPVITGSVITNADGSQGVVFYLNPMGTGGTMVALEDVSTGCTWGDATDVNALRNYFDTNSQNTLNDMNGYANTEAIRNQLGTGTGYAADVVDFANGWYLPSANQLRKLYGALPFVESAIESQGGTLMTENSYWSSTEFSYSEAWNPIFAMGHTSKTSSCRVRAVRDFSYDGSFTIMAESSIGSVGAVAGSGVYADGAPVTVVAAVPSSTGYTFNCWKEDGVVVSRSQVYTFTAHSNRHLVAEFRVGVNIGTVVTNADGTKGVVFYTDETGTSGTMVALEDVSTGCAWGDATDINPLHNFFDSYAYNSLNDMNGYANTEAIRNQQGAGTGYAADVVDFANGWYLPSANQLRKIYGALPFIEEVIVAEGGTVLTENSYWSSTEYSFSDAWNPAFAMGYASKSTNCRVRAVRDFSLDGTFVVSVQSSVGSAGAVAGSGVYDDGAQVTVLATAPSNPGYAFRCWKEDGIVVSMDPVYTFTAHSNRNLIAEFVIENSIGCVVTNPDGSKGVVFYTDPSGAKGWMVALEDASAGCPWGDNQNVVPLTDYNPNQVQNLLEDLSGYRNTQVLRGWFMDNTDYAASKVDFPNGWYLPSAGQLRKLYAALPFIEDILLREGGTTLTDGSYWSSTECSDTKAWSPAFAIGNTNKSSNLRVRAIHDVYIEAVAGSGDITFVGTVNSSWSEVGNWINNEGSLPSLTDDVVVAANCVMNMNATVKSVTLRPRSELTVTANHCLNVTESISNTADSKIILVDGAQLINPTDDVYVSVRKNISGYGNDPNSSWYTISTPIKDGTSADVLATDGYDLFQYFEQFHYWLNHKEDGNDFTRLNCGIGYLYASQNDRTLIFNGTVRASNSEYYKSITNSPNSAPISGFNLIGNPFTNNINISSLSLNETVFTSYYKVKNGSVLLVYTDADQEPIRLAEGFFVQGDAGYVCYNTPSRTEPNNGYVRLVLNHGGPSTGSGADCVDRAYLKMNGGEALNKAYVERQPSLLYFNCSGQNYAVASQRAQAYNLCFETEVGGVFTIESSLLNTECGYLHLVDRLAGEEVDLLAMPSYSFEAAPSDAPNRFVLVLVEGAQPEEYVWARNRDLLPMLPIHYVTTNQPAYIDYVTKTTALDQGWTWWAPEVRASVPEIQSALGSNMQEILSQEGTPSGNVVPGQMFKIRTTAPCSLALTGLPVSAAIITINPGYNWLGYFGEAALITQVFNRFTPATGDKIIAQDEGFAIYNGTSWEGTLTTLQPGHGYVYFSTASGTKTVVFE